MYFYLSTNFIFTVISLGTDNIEGTLRFRTFLYALVLHLYIILESSLAESIPSSYLDYIWMSNAKSQTMKHVFVWMLSKSICWIWPRLENDWTNSFLHKMLLWKSFSQFFYNTISTVCLVWSKTFIPFVKKLTLC